VNPPVAVVKDGLRPASVKKQSALTYELIVTADVTMPPVEEIEAVVKVWVLLMGMLPWPVKPHVLQVPGALEKVQLGPIGLVQAASL